MTRLIDNITQIESAIPTLSFDDISHMYGTGRSFTYMKNASEKIVKYRHGVMTKIGDIEESVWEEIVMRLIKCENEEMLFNQLLEWIKTTLCWARDDKEARNYALKLFSARIFDNVQWVDYYQFNRKYRPEKIDKK